MTPRQRKTEVEKEDTVAIYRPSRSLTNKEQLPQPRAQPCRRNSTETDQSHFGRKQKHFESFNLKKRRISRSQYSKPKTTYASKESQLGKPTKKFGKNGSPKYFANNR
ncbi:hypothetical protein DR996_30360 [Vibrio owensii]|nr:hypothetical protein DR996_30360 [Vibrio owensii]